ncbi:polygalacturonase-like [Typha angustifolia]|uniref:polygalacturonase-like n=1 Tax=Typha angustifolia TaxID=59011 RepID=UPI003C2D5CD5
MAELMHLFLLSLLFFYSLPGANAVYNIQDYGAKPDGTTDSARSIIRAWAAACGSAQPATIHVPTGNFLVSQASFSGPCKSAAIKFWIEGTIVAPAGYGAIGSSGKWISFSKVDGVSISGGSLDGRGAALWSCKLAGRSCPTGASSLTFTNSKNVTIDGLTSINAELFHIVILRCHGVTVNGVNIRAPGNSPNTDGIHVQMSTGVTIAQANIKTGDDCISVGPGTAHLWIERVFCGPGHGISIGSLGKGQGGLSEEGVENVTVKTTTFFGTQNGVRIKTWGTGRPGNVSRVVFENAVMKNVQNPIIIDQNYCPTKKGCPNKSSGIKVSEVKYVGIHGTSATQVAVNFDCSPSNPCSGISLQDIKLSYQNQRAHSYCKHAYGIASGSVVPPSCL